MHDITQAVAFLESLSLAHGDLRPENILLDGDRVKLSDFDWTEEVGSSLDSYEGTYGRLLNSDEASQGEPGTPGLLGPRTSQFALGSIFYFINYGFEAYADQRITDNPHDHGPKTVDLMQNKQFPDLNGDPMIDNIISKCWHNKYPTIAELATEMKMLLPDEDTASNIDTDTTSVDQVVRRELTR